MGADEDFVFHGTQEPDTHRRQAVVGQAPGRAAIQRFDQADFRPGPDVLRVVGPHQQVIDRHIGETVGADGSGAEARNVRPGRAQIRGFENLGALGEREQHVGRVGLGRMGRQARDAAHGHISEVRRGRESHAGVGREHDVGGAVHA